MLSVPNQIKLKTNKNDTAICIVKIGKQWIVAIFRLLHVALPYLDIHIKTK